MMDIKEIFKCTSGRHRNAKMTLSAEEPMWIGVHPKTYTSLGFVFTLILYYSGANILSSVITNSGIHVLLKQKGLTQMCQKKDLK